ncbi:MAG: DoxX family protein [Firmicutes bacterium]|jgi:thiosulfate dehydrogenase [quinone] large subunit|nr:DoxX family protein [Bacillota bacterium]
MKLNSLITEPEEIHTPRSLHYLTHSKAMGVVWSALRIWLGVMWIQAGVSKLWGAENSAFLHNNGAAVAGFASHGIPAYSWWGSFLHGFVVPNADWVAVLVSISEFLVGLGLVLGFLTPAAATVGALLNFTYVMSGTASVNAFYALVAIVILATWRTSSEIGIDGFIRAYRQTHNGRLFKKNVFSGLAKVKGGTPKVA